MSSITLKANLLSYYLVVCFCQEMEIDYLQSVKRSILDYVLMDSNEQQRLGLEMKKQVSFLQYH